MRKEVVSNIIKKIETVIGLVQFNYNGNFNEVIKNELNNIISKMKNCKSSFDFTSNKTDSFKIQKEEEKRNEIDNINKNLSDNNDISETFLSKQIEIESIQLIPEQKKKNSIL